MLWRSWADIKNFVNQSKIRYEIHSSNKDDGAIGLFNGDSQW